MRPDYQFEAQVEKMKRQLLAFFFRLLHDPEAAERLAANAFLQVYRTCPAVSAHDFAILVYRVGLDLAAQQRNEQEQRPDPAFVEGSRPAAIRDAVAKLPDRERVALLLHKYQGLNCGDIGVILSVDESGATALVLSAYEHVRENLREL